MNQKKGIEPLHIVILVVAWIADIFIVFSDQWDGFPLTRVLLLLFVALPPLVLLIWLASRLIKALRGMDPKKRTRALAIVATAVVLIAAGIVLFAKVLPARRQEQFTAQVDALLESGDDAATAEILRGRLDTRALQQTYAPAIRESAVLRDGLFAPGAAVYFGRDYTSDKKDKLMKWYVLDRDGELALLFMAEPERPDEMSNCMYWSSPRGGTMWAESQVRKSTDSAMRKIFTDAELDALQLTTLESESYFFDASGYNPQLGPIQTEDYLFLLSTDELTAYDVYGLSTAKGCSDLWGSVAWWTRTASDYSEFMCAGPQAMTGDFNGLYSSKDAQQKYCVRFAAWVDIDALLATWAGSDQ